MGAGGKPLSRPDGAVLELIQNALGDPRSGWASGSYGAIAEFSRRDGDQAVADLAPNGGTVITDLGALRIALVPGVLIVPYETPTRRPEVWLHGVAFCLEAGAAAMGGAEVIGERGPDRDAIRAQDRDQVLFDLGLGTGAITMAVRTCDKALIEGLRAAAGRSLLAPEEPMMAALIAANPHRVCFSKLARIEVTQNIGLSRGTEGRGPGPHTHVIPKLLAEGRAHGPEVPIPPGLSAALYLFPPNPVVDADGARIPFDKARHGQFQALWERFADPALVALKRRTAAAVRAGRAPDRSPSEPDPARSAALRVALRQLGHSDGPSPTLAAWSARYDPVS